VKRLSSVRLEHRNKGATVTLLSHFITNETLSELNLILDQSSETIVLAGIERSFATGADIRRLNSFSPLEALTFSRHGQSVLNRLSTRVSPVIAAIDGFCLGGGLDLALACHFRYATPRAKFGHPGGKIGLMTGWGGTHRLPDWIGKTRATEMMITGKWLDTATAISWGLIDEVVSHPIDYAFEKHPGGFKITDTEQGGRKEE
jgi:enoyl-CoA hydratase/carnithine racemase